MSSPDFATVAALVGEPARAAMLSMLFDGRALPAGQLARGAGISASTASVHLAKLLEGGLLRVRSQGRHRYYEFSRPEIAQALESLGSICRPERVSSLSDSLRTQRLRFARSCYNHLAGELAIALVQALLRRGALEAEDDGYRLRSSALGVLLELGIDARSVFRNPHAHVKTCVDWTERRPHISGPLGVAILRVLLERGFLQRRSEPRVLLLTPPGRDVLADFGVTLASDEAIAG